MAFAIQSTGKSLLSSLMILLSRRPEGAGFEEAWRGVERVEAWSGVELSIIFSHLFYGPLVRNVITFLTRGLGRNSSTSIFLNVKKKNGPFGF